jgi:hypothetical protein
MRSLIQTRTAKPVSVELIRAAYADAVSSARTAVEQAMHVGSLLIEAKESIVSGSFQLWIKQELPEISYRTAARWMEAARRAMDSSGAAKLLPEGVPSSLICQPAQEGLSGPAAKAQQLFLDFINNKTIKECLSAVVVGGEEPHRVTRAANGRAHGGYKGEDRKAFETFIARDVRQITSHLRHKLTPVQRTAISAAFDSALADWPRWLCDVLAEAARRECKRADKARDL